MTTRKRFTSIVFVGIGSVLSILSCQMDDSKQWNNPADPHGSNYSQPAMRAYSDTIFADTSLVKLHLVATSPNTSISKVEWSVDGGSVETTGFDTSNSVMTLHLPALSEARHVAVVRVQDRTGLWSEPDTVRFKVWNEPPRLRKVRDTSLAGNKTLSIGLSATDVDGAVSKTYWGLVKGDWMDSSGTVTLKPKSTCTKTVYWLAKDDLGKTAQDSFVATFTNQAPVLVKVIDTILPTRRTLSLSLSGLDSDGQVVRYFFDTSGGRWDSCGSSPTLKLSSSSDTLRTIVWGARDDLGSVALDTFAVQFATKLILTQVRDTALSASKSLQVSLRARDADTSGKIEKYLWSTSC